MKHFYLTVIALCMFLVVQRSIAQERPFGLGFMVGEPSGFSAKWWASNDNAFDFGLGWSVIGNRYNGGSGIHLHADYLWHAWNAIHSTERFPLYYGIGGRYRGAGSEGSLAVRGVFGLAWMPYETPIDIFVEVVPSIELTSSTGFFIDGSLGARYYF